MTNPRTYHTLPTGKPKPWGVMSAPGDWGEVVMPQVGPNWGCAIFCEPPRAGPCCRVPSAVGVKFRTETGNADM